MIIVDNTGTMITKEKQIISNFKKYFESFINLPITGHDSDLNIDCQAAEIDI